MVRRRIHWQARKQAERSFTARVKIYSSWEDPEFNLNPSDGRVWGADGREHIVHWEGPGKIAYVTREEDDTQTGILAPEATYMLHIPAPALGETRLNVRPGDSVRVLKDPHGGMEGWLFSIVQSVQGKTHATHRRLLMRRSER